MLKDVNNYEALREYLKNGTCIVVFVKTDGTKREMKCTLDMSLIPEDVLTTSKPQLLNEDNLDDDLLTVWDVEKQAWRSFYVSSVLNVKDE